MNRVFIRGDGIAACCCEHLLTKAGVEVGVEPAGRPRLPAVMLSEMALALIRDVFGKQDLFSASHRIQKRVVAWKPGAEPVAMKHSAIVVSEQQLLQAVRRESSSHQSGQADWTVVTSPPFPADAVEHRFGTRMAHAVQVALRGEPDTCCIESLAEGWLFLIPNSETGGWLLAVGGGPHELLAQSKLVTKLVTVLDKPVGEFAAYPRLLSPLCGTAWLACGTAAMGFDPICGDGTANAVREAILASAVIGAASEGADPDELRRHYELRLNAGFQRHLELCLHFYQTGGSGPWWEREAAELVRGLTQCSQKSREFGGYRYQLRGFQLVPVLTS